MGALLLRLLGSQIIHRTAGHAARHSRFSFRLGWKLMRDRRVAGRYKLLAVFLGCMLMLGLDLLELPAEAFLAVALPVLGIPIDVTVSGLENVIAPVLFSGLLLPFLAPRALTEQVRQELDGLVIDVPGDASSPTAA